MAALAITITDFNCARCVNISQVGAMYKRANGIKDKMKGMSVKYQQGTREYYVEVQFEKDAHALYHDELARLIGCDCAVVGQCGTEWYVCGFNK